MKIKTAHSPVWADEQKTKISLDVDFDETDFPGLTPFVADSNDYESHGKSLFKRAEKGEFGVVKPFVPTIDIALSIDVKIADKKESIIQSQLVQIAITRGTSTGNLTNYEAKINRLIVTAQTILLDPVKFKGTLFDGVALPNTGVKVKAHLTTFLMGQANVSTNIEQIILDHDALMARLAIAATEDEVAAITW